MSPPVDRLVDATAGRVVGPAFGLASGPRLPPPRPLERLDPLAQDVDRVRFDLLVAGPVGPWATVGEIELGATVPDARGERLRHTPFHDAGGVEPVGTVNALRRRAYADSQAARPS